jgi:TPR repeat protein
VDGATCTAESDQAEAGVAEQQSVLGDCYVNGNSPYEVNVFKAVEWYQKSAAQNNSDGQFGLGSVYQKGLGGMKVDTVEALRLFLLSATQGNGDAYNTLGNMSRFGYGGFEQNDSDAVKFFRLSAQHGTTCGAVRLTGAALQKSFLLKACQSL